MFNVAGSSSRSYPSTNTVGIDPGDAGNVMFMGAYGQLQPYKLGGVVIHELIHAIDGTMDLLNPDGTSRPWDFNNPNFDFLGKTVEKENIINQEMGWGPEYYRVGYAATAPLIAPYLNPNISYTEGNHIDIAYFGFAGTRYADFAQNPTNLDLSQRTDNDLIIGGFGNVTIRGGSGNDYLYGGFGSDTISGGSGNNLIDGGIQGASTSGVATADYSVGMNGQQRPHGVTVQIEPDLDTSSQMFFGVAPIIVSDNGYGGTDRLVSI